METAAIVETAATAMESCATSRVPFATRTALVPGEAAVNEGALDQANIDPVESEINGAPDDDATGGDDE